MAQSVKESIIEKGHLIEVSVWDKKDGLPFWNMNDMIKDQSGAIWMSSPEELCRFDGFSFERYPHPAIDLSNQYFAYLGEDPKGNIWVYKKMGEPFTAFIFDPFEQKTIPFTTYTGDSIPEIRGFQDYFRTKEGIYFFSPREVWFYGDTLEKVASFNTPPKGNERFFPGPDGNFWKITGGKSVQLLDRTQKELVRFSLPHEIIRNLCWLDDDNHLWIVTAKQDTLPTQWVRITPEQIEEIPLQQLNITNWGNQQKVYEPNIAAIGNGYVFVPRKGKQYTLLHDGQILIPSLNKWLADRYQIKLNLNQLYTLESDGVIWLSGVGSLIRLKFTPSPFAWLLNSPGQPISTRQITKTASGQLAICSYNGLYLYDGKNPPAQTSIPVVPVLKSVLATDNSLWIGTNTSLVYQYFPDRDRYRTLQPSGPEKPRELNCFFRLPSSGLVAGCDNGLWGIDSLQGTIQRIAMRDTAIFFTHTSGEQLWMGTQYGLYNWRNRELHTFSAPGQKVAPQLSIYHLSEDSEGVFWMATSQGLLKWRPSDSSFRLFSEKEGVPSGRLHSVYPDRKGNLWLSSDNGLVQFDPAINHTVPLANLQGIQHKEFNFMAHYQDAEGTLYYGGLDGVVSFHPDSLPETKLQNIHDIQLRKVLLTNWINPDQVTEKSFREAPERIRIPAQTRQVSLQFSFPHYEQVPAALQWRLPGYANEWQSLNNHQLTLQRLPYGKQTLDIRAYPDYSPGHPLASTTIGLDVAYPFYLRWWFLLLALLISTGIIRLIIIWRGKQLKAQNLELQQLVDKKTEKIQRQAEKLEALLKVKNQLFIDISHEFRTPLSLILGYAELLVKELEQSGEHTNSAREIQQNSRYIWELIEDILNLSRLESRELPLQPGVCEWPLFFYQIQRRFRGQAEEKGIHFQLEIHPSEEEIFFLDQKKVTRVINNLISNALKFTPPGGTVKVKVQKEGALISVYVSDTGPGITETDRPYIFDRYYKGDHSPNTGFGIGLALCKAYAELMQGTLSLSDTSPSGSTFHFRFPLSDAPDILQQQAAYGVPENIRRDALPSTNKLKEQQRPHLLLVEDNKSMQDLLCQILHTDYQLTTAANGQEALEKLTPETDVALIVSDIMMPKMDGFVLLETIRTTPHLQHLPVLLLTAMAERDAQKKAFRLGVDFFLAKPFEAEELKARVAGMIHNISLRKAYLQSLPLKERTTRDDPETQPDHSFDHLWLKELEGIIKKRIDDRNLKIGDLAMDLHISERTLRNRVKSYTGLTPAQYVKKVRLHQALLYLENRRFPTISEVCFAVGLQSVSHFSKIFQEEFGVMPSEYAPEKKKDPH